MIGACNSDMKPKITAKAVRATTLAAVFDRISLLWECHEAVDKAQTKTWTKIKVHVHAKGSSCEWPPVLFHSLSKRGAGEAAGGGGPVPAESSAFGASPSVAARESAGTLPKARN